MEPGQQVVEAQGQGARLGLLHLGAGEGGGVAQGRDLEVPA